MTIILFILGFVLVIKGGDWFVDAASWLAELTGIPKFIVGATIVSLATTLPELMVSIMAVLNGANDMGVGNAIGSVSCNLGIGLALTIIFAPSKVNKKDFFIKGFLMLIGAVALLFSVRDNKLIPRESLLLFAILISFIILNVMAVKSVKEINVKSKKKNLKRDKLIFNIIKFIMGAAFIVFGADLMVENGEKIAHSLGIPESIIGLTLIAVGTSLPEIVTAITALIKKETSMSVGNILGANIIDLTLILPVCSFLSKGGLIVNTQTVIFDMPISIALILLTVIPTILIGGFKRWQGIILIGIYGGYLASIAF